ncbi:MAG: calcium-binding protein, partial [Asticcacaulis sp.]
MSATTPTNTVLFPLVNLTLLGTDDSYASGTLAANVIIGNDGNNLIDGYGGGDTLQGGLGNDTYVVFRRPTTIIEAAGGGIDTINANFNYTLADNFENLSLVGSATVGTGNALDNVITSVVDTVSTLYGLDGNDTLNGWEGADIVDGGTGADTMSGGAGDDTFMVDNAGDVATEDGGRGTDLVISSVSFLLGANIENLTLTGLATVGTGKRPRQPYPRRCPRQQARRQGGRRP